MWSAGAQYFTEATSCCLSLFSNFVIVVDYSMFVNYVMECCCWFCSIIFSIILFVCVALEKSVLSRLCPILGRASEQNIKWSLTRLCSLQSVILGQRIVHKRTHTHTKLHRWANSSLQTCYILHQIIMCVGA